MIQISIQWFALIAIAIVVLMMGAGLAIIINTVLSDARESREKAQTAQKNYQQFIYLLSHECSTPLQTILTCLGTLAQVPPRTDDWRRNYDLALEETRRLGRLIDDMRQLAHLETPEAPRTLQLVNLGSVIQSVLIKYSDQTEATQVELQYDGPERLPVVLGSRDQLTRVLDNLVENAIKYRRSGDGARITVSAVVNSERIYVRVSDNGQGIAPEDLPHIFTPRFRSSEATVSKRKGLGLGLAIVKRIVEQHGGKIEARSQLGEHTVFSFWLPNARAAETPPSRKN